MSRAFYIIGGILLLAIAIVLAVGLNYAFQRWKFLELMKLDSWLSGLPLIGPYMSKTAGARRELRKVTNFDRTLRRYGVDTEDLSKNIKTAKSSGGGSLIKQYLPKQAQSLVKGKDVTANALQKKGAGFFADLLPKKNESVSEPEQIDDAGYVGLSESATAATLAYLSDPAPATTLVQPTVAAAVASVVVSAPIEQNHYGALDRSKPVLVISMPQSQDQYFPVSDPTLILGSDPDCDIHLAEPGVGGRHLQIDQTEHGWSVTDLGALGGTYLDSSQLLSNVPEIWTKEYPIKIGQITVRLVELSGSEYDEMFNHTAVHREKPGLAIFPTEQRCEAGQTSVWQLHMTNQGKAVDHFAVIVSGFLAGWVELEQAQKPLMPGESTMISLAITPPRLPSATAGVHTGSVRVQAVSAQDSFAVAELKLDIAPFDAWETELSHPQLKSDTKASVKIRNEGNHETSLQVSAEAESDRFELHPFQTSQTYSLAAGAETVVPVSIQNLKRPFFGMRRNESFSLVAASTSGDYAVQHPGVFEIRPIVPTWLMSIIGFLLPFLCLIATIGYTFNESRNMAATATAEALALANLALTPTPTPIPTATPKPVIYPTSCRQLKGYLAQVGEDPDPDIGWVDGEFELFANGDLNLPMTVYCHGMASNDPQEFISLQALGDQSNFSRYAYPDGEIVVQFEKIRINPTDLTVDTTDRTFANTTDTRQDQVFDPPDYGSAKGCTAEENRVVNGSANIDLTGTQYALPAVDEVYVAQGKNMSEPLIVLAASQQQLDLEINGSCGWLIPQQGIQLYLVN